MKKCGRCKQEKELTEFYSKGDRKDVSCYCKECLRKNALIRMKVFKEQCVEYKGGKCEMCGYDYSHAALDFHHKDPTEKEFTIAKAKLKNFITHEKEIKKELDKCILLCANCHREAHEEFSVQNLLDDKEQYLEVRNQLKQEKLDNLDLICECGKPKSYRSIVCINCKNKASNERNSQEVLDKVNKLGYAGAGRYYGISDNAIKKFLKVRNLI